MVKERFPMTIGGIMIANEDQLLKDEGGEKMSGEKAVKKMSGEKAVRYLIVHCSATRSTQSYSVEQLLRDHRARGFRTIGYHFYIRRDRTLTQHRGALIAGHRDMPGATPKDCPCFDAGKLLIQVLESQ